MRVLIISLRTIGEVALAFVVLCYAIVIAAANDPH
jgi:hypothetical protein